VPERGATHTFIQEQWTMPDGEWQVTRCDAVLRRPPLEWGLIAGDAIHNMRSALDHLACVLVGENGGEITRSTSFPLYERPPNRRGHRRIDASLKGMHSDNEARIRAMQPYLDPESDRSKRIVRLSQLEQLRQASSRPSGLRTIGVRLDRRASEDGPPFAH
jgi:hypothetical protein